MATMIVAGSSMPALAVSLSTSSPTTQTFYPSAIRTWAPGAKHTATGFYNRVISTNRCERNHSRSYVRACHVARIVNRLGQSM
jgi:hypothetical protein